MPVHTVTSKEIKPSIRALLVEMQLLASTSLFDWLPALLRTVTDSTAALHSPRALTQRFQSQAKGKERSVHQAVIE